MCCVQSLQYEGIKHCNYLSQHTVYTACALGHVPCHCRKSVTQSVISYVIPNCCCFSWVRRCSLLQHVSRRLRKLPWACALGRGTFRGPSSSPLSWLSPTVVSLTATNCINTNRSCVSLARPSPSSFLRHRRLATDAVAVLHTLLSSC